jgi:hypothetical protein
LKKIVLAAFVAFSVSACTSSSNVYEINPGLYSVHATGDGWTSADQVFGEAKGKAVQFCARAGKNVRVVDEQTAYTRQGMDTTKQIRFVCV